MPGYTHTCASCEAKMKIHERYVGRALHCPHCGTEFLADPMLADVDDIIEDLAPGEQRRIPWIWLLMIAVVLLVAVLVLGQSEHHGLLAKLFKPTRSVGQNAVLVIEGRELVPATMERETIVFVVDAIEDDDPGSMQALRVQGRIVEVGSGTRVRLLERVRGDRAARVRILEGAWTGRVLWVPLIAVQ
jgi:hypothetical protein